jgi:hypothetical protein
MGTFDRDAGKIMLHGELDGVLDAHAEHVGELLFGKELAARPGDLLDPAVDLDRAEIAFESEFHGTPFSNSPG